MFLVQDFHYSSLLALPLVFLKNIRFNAGFYYGLILLGLLCFLIRSDLYHYFLDLIKTISNYIPYPLSDKINTYLTLQSKGLIAGSKDFTLFNFYSLLTVPSLFFMIHHYKKLVEISEESIIYLKSCIYGNTFFLIFSAFPVMASRASLFFFLPSIILYGSICNLFKQRKLVKTVVIFISLIYGGLFYLRIKGYISL